MKIKYVGNNPVRFVSINSHNGLVNPGEIIDVTDEVFEQLKTNDVWEVVTEKKSKGDK